MEYAREEMLETANEGQETVLILVLVEYAPRGLIKELHKKTEAVLILVLLEYAPRDRHENKFKQKRRRS